MPRELAFVSEDLMRAKFLTGTFKSSQAMHENPTANNGHDCTQPEDLFASQQLIS